MVRADAVAAVFGGHGQVRFVGTCRRAHRRPRAQGGSSDSGGHGGVGVV
jgi:hypothetical protein